MLLSIVDKSIPRRAEKKQSKQDEKSDISGRIADSCLFVWLNVDKKYQNCGNKDN